MPDTSVTPGSHSKPDTSVTPRSGHVEESLFDANTILKADTDDTPVALEIGTHKLIGRLGGSITAITVGLNRVLAQLSTGLTGVFIGANSVLGRAGGEIEDIPLGTNNLLGRKGSDVESIAMGAQTLLARTSGNIVGLGVAASRIVGRTAGGNLNDLTASEVRTVIDVEENADVTDAANVDAAGATMNSDVQSKGIYVADPEDDEDWPFFHTPVAITVTAIFGETDTGTVDLKMYWRPEGAAFAGGTAIEDTALVADDDEQRQTSGFEDATIPAGSYVVLVTSAVADSPTKLTAGIEFTVD
jgi:hypothetical protein